MRRRLTLEEQRNIPSWHGLSLFVYIIICRQLKLVGEGWTGLEEVEEVERGLVTVNSRLMSEREVQHKHATIRATNNHQHRSPAPVSLLTFNINYSLCWDSFIQSVGKLIKRRKKINRGNTQKQKCSNFAVFLSKSLQQVKVSSHCCESD